MVKTTAPYGSWTSPITTDLMTEGSVGLGHIMFDSEDVYWMEGRPQEKGRGTLVRAGQNNESPQTILPEPHNIRSWVHEYGGGAYTLHEGKVYFSDPIASAVMFGDLETGQTQELIESKDFGYADFQIDVRRNQLLCVSEERDPDGGEPKGRISAITLDGKVRHLVEGADFYSSPRMSPSGLNICWLEWSHPDMPWDATRLMRARIEIDGSLSRIEQVAGGEGISIVQPEYGPNGTLHYMSDESGYWNLYRCGEQVHHFEMQGDCAYPHWVFGMRSYALLGDGRAAVANSVDGDWRLSILTFETGEWQHLNLPWVTFDSIVSNKGRLAFHGGKADGPDEIVVMDTENWNTTVLMASSKLSVPAEGISKAETIVFPTLPSEDGTERVAYANFYPPANIDFVAPEGELPPVIVRSHGGPTGQSTAGLSLKYQYWTSRGFAVLDVNYSGSTGYGREYRDRLAGNWGVLDVADCENAAKYMVEQGRVDGNRLIIAGGSAGGYTTLAALTFTDTFKAGCSSYGIGDLAMLAKDTHKFESRYMDKLVGVWPADAETYRERSPLSHTELLNCPVLFLQGEEDKVVPPNQANDMSAALKEKGVPVAYLLFEGEGHGFRKAETIKSALEAELSFYTQIFGINISEGIERLPIDNLN